MNGKQYISDNHIDFVSNTSVFAMESIVTDPECRYKGFSPKHFADSVFCYTV